MEKSQGFGDRMDDFAFEVVTPSAKNVGVVKEPSALPSKPSTGTIPGEEPEGNVLQ
jgi:hypothetical protein